MFDDGKFSFRGSILFLRNAQEKKAPQGRKPIRDWHKKWDDKEPDCAASQWRREDRFNVIDMAHMDDGHLGHAIRFATTKAQHASRLGGLLAERERRRRVQARR